MRWKKLKENLPLRWRRSSLHRPAGAGAEIAMSRRTGFMERREFLRALAGMLAFPTVSRLASAAASSPNAYLFSEVPSSASGITWKHTAGLSPEKYLPESTGAGCAFFDYDNDGWMDIYFVNSGPCDIFTPDSAAAKRSLPEQSRRHLHRRHRKSRRGRRAATGWASRWATTTPTDSLTFTSPNMAAAFCIATTATEHSPTSLNKPAWRLRDGPPAQYGSTTTTTAGSISSSAASWISTSPSITTAGRRNPGDQGAQRILLSANLHADGKLAVSQQWRRHVHRRQPEDGDRRQSRQVLGRGGHRHQQRRLDGPFRRQRHGRQFSLRQSRREAI